MQKPSISRTLGQIHFEDLEPHRFEDLVRQLIYDYKDWQSIEATGRGGADDGYDIRAYEKQSSLPQEGDEEIVEFLSPMNGRLWMIQCKREKEIGPSKIKNIVKEGVDPNEPPYGYILAAAANISKKTYDAFRHELQLAGVMEFYLWGKAELEDLLLLPKNDRILFTFFGISLVTKRQSKTNELRSRIAVKNKLISLLGSSAVFYQDVLLRDLNDDCYPFADLDPDFAVRPKWQRTTAFEYHPFGIWCHVHEYFGYIDLEKKEYDYVSLHDFISNDDYDDELSTRRHEQQMMIRSNWELLPRHQQVKIKMEGLVKYNDIVLVDSKGDFEYEMPHIFLDYQGKFGPYARLLDVVDINGEEILLKDFKRVKFFPDKFEEITLGRVHEDLQIEFSTLLGVDQDKHNLWSALYSIDDRYTQLKSKDVILLSDEEGEKKHRWMVTSVYNCKVSDHLLRHQGLNQLKSLIETQLKNAVSNNKNINVYELKRLYDWE